MSNLPVIFVGEVWDCPAQSVIKESCICKPGWGHRSERVDGAGDSEALKEAIRNEIITSHTTCAGDYDEAREHADKIIKAAEASLGQNSKNQPIAGSDVATMRDGDSGAVTARDELAKKFANDILAATGTCDHEGTLKNVCKKCKAITAACLEAYHQAALGSGPGRSTESNMKSLAKLAENERAEKEKARLQVRELREGLRQIVRLCKEKIDS